MNRKVRDMCLIALMAAIICVASPIAIPIGEVPISLATLTVYIAGALLGLKKGTAAVLIYILLGAVGVPVFANYSAGMSVVLGVTGGYIIGYLPCAAITGIGAELFGEKKLSIKGKGFPWAYPVFMVIGTVVLYAVGTVWFIIQTKMSLSASMAVCVIPFLPGDALKIVVATVLGSALRGRLKKAGVLR